MTAASPSRPPSKGQEFRCEHKLFAVRRDGMLEVKCNSNRCGARPGVVVLHYFDLEGNLQDTKMYKDPGRIIK